MSGVSSRPGSPDRRAILKSALGMAVLSVAAPMINRNRYQVFAATPRQYSKRAVELIEGSLVIDMLGVLTLDNSVEGAAAPVSEQTLEPFRTCGITGFMNSNGVSGPTEFAGALEFLAMWHGYVGRRPELFTLVSRAEDLDRAKAHHKIAVMMGIQDAEHFRDASDVKYFYQLGLRCSQLTYNSQNRLGSGCTERVDGGVSDFGAEIIRAMNATGMLIDVSHCGDRTTLDAIELSGQPVAVTHSNCRALNEHPRLKTDEAIRKLAGKGGVMGITGVRNFVRDREPTTVEHIVEHIDHVVRLVGIEHVGIGSDADLNGYDDMPAPWREAVRAGNKPSYAFREKFDTDGFDHPRKMFDLTEALIRRGYSDANIAAILGGNFRRLARQVWK